MDEYTKLKTEIDAYLEKEDVELTDQQISVYDLYNIVNNKLAELREICFNSKCLKDINKNLKFGRLGSILRRETIRIYESCDEVTPRSNGKTSSIAFRLKYREHLLRSCWIRICKDVNSDEIYFDTTTTDKGLVAKYYDQISEMFTILEEFSSLYQGAVGYRDKDVHQIFSDGFLTSDFSYDQLGRIEIDLNLTKEADPNNIYKREWFQRQRLSDYVEENKENLMKKIPVDIEKLNHTTKTIVEDYTKKLNAPLLVKKK